MKMEETKTNKQTPLLTHKRTYTGSGHIMPEIV